MTRTIPTDFVDTASTTVPRRAPHILGGSKWV